MEREPVRVSLKQGAQGISRKGQHGAPDRTPSRAAAQGGLSGTPPFHLPPDPLRTRLLAGLGIVLAAAVVAVLTQLSVWATVTGTVLLLALFTAFMHSAGALATAVVCVGWTVVAHTLMSIPLHGQPALLLIPLLPLPVALVAARISAFPVWHTTLVTLLGGLIVGFGLALAHMTIPAVPASRGSPGWCWVPR